MMRESYHATIFYTDISGIEAMWQYHLFITSTIDLPTKESAEKWVEDVKEFWKTPKMKKRFLYESHNIGITRREIS